MSLRPTLRKSSVHALTVPAIEPLRPVAVGVLDPDELSFLAENAARSLLHEGESDNTRISYASAMRYWCAWFAARYGRSLALPVGSAVVIQFIVDHAVRTAGSHVPATSRSDLMAPDGNEQADAAAAPGVAAAASTARPDVRPTLKLKGTTKSKASQKPSLVTELPAEIDQALVACGAKAKLGPPSLNTLVHRIAVLSKAHQLANETNPCADPVVRALLASTRRAYAQRGARTRKQRALTKDPLQALLATCDESLKGKRDRALLLFAWASGGRRRSEVVAATIENLQRVDAKSYLYTLGFSKTNQSGDARPEDVKPLVGIAAVAMKAWLDASGVTEGAIFRRIRKGGHVGEALAPAAVRDIVKERCLLAGIEGAFSAHSLRAGFVTEAGRQNMSLPETMALTGHQSVTVVMGYFRAESGLNSKVSRMLDDQ